MLPFLEINKNLLKYSSFHTPAIAQYFFELQSQEDIGKLHDIWKFAQVESLPIIFIGSGTNIVFAFDVYKGIIVRNNIKGKEQRGDTMKILGGELISPLSLKISKEVKNSLFEKWIGLPGTVGGAVAGNAGCFGFETKDALEEVTIFDMEIGITRILTNSELHFSYRHSVLKGNPSWFLIDVTFRTNLVGEDGIDPRTFRSGKQPCGFTCGSFFRNPPGDSAGRLIDQVGLKGHRIGGARISEIHANFFIHDVNGSYKDILALRDLAKEKVYEMFGIELEEEARIIQNK